MNLSPEVAAAAEACGVQFLVASQSQTYRLAMQRKVFDNGGAPHLATRDGSLFETAATLKHLIVEERRQAR